MTRDEHVEIICEKWNRYREIMDSNFSNDDYPYKNLDPWTNFYYEENEVLPELIEFEKFYDINKNVNGTTCSNAGDRPLQG